MERRYKILVSSKKQDKNQDARQFESGMGTDTALVPITFKCQLTESV